VTKPIATSARNSLWLMFFVMGVVSMAWVPRIPEIKEANGLSDTQFGSPVLWVQWLELSLPAD
jgi:hypothetical protein